MLRTISFSQGVAMSGFKSHRRVESVTLAILEGLCLACTSAAQVPGERKIDWENNVAFNKSIRNYPQIRNAIFLFLSLLLSVCLYSPTWAATINCDCSNAATVNTALTNASSGDIVLCTGSGWSSGTVTIPNTKNITLDGNGATISGSARLVLPSSANYYGRVTRFTFTTTTRRCYFLTATDVGKYKAYNKVSKHSWKCIYKAHHHSRCR